jgi:hypothetical protein
MKASQGKMEANQETIKAQMDVNQEAMEAVLEKQRLTNRRWMSFKRRECQGGRCNKLYSV